MPANPQDQNLAEAIRRGHEPTDANVRMLIISGIILALAVPVIAFFVWIHFVILAGTRWMGLNQPRIAVSWYAPQRSYPKPHLIVVPGQELRLLQNKEDSQLSSYGWINPTQEIVRIPIERAMQLVVARGLPVRQPGVSNVDSSEYELVIQRRLERDRDLKEGKPSDDKMPGQKGGAE